MSYNVITYILYLSATLVLVSWMGASLHRNGKRFLVMCVMGNVTLADAVNKVLLTGYYLINIGYTVYNLKIWQKVEGWVDVTEALGAKIGFIAMLLGGMHLLNVLTLLFFGKKIAEMYKRMIHTDY